MANKPKKTKEEPWKIPPKYAAMLGDDDTAFLLDHAEKRLADSLETNKIIVDKSTTFLTLSLSLVAALIGYYMDKRGNDKAFDAIQLAALVGAGYLFVVGVLFSINIFNWKYFVLGALPRVFFVDGYFGGKMDCNERVICMRAHEIKEYQKRILWNEKTNRWRWNLFRVSYMCLVGSPAIVSVAYLLAK